MERALFLIVLACALTAEEVGACSLPHDSMILRDPALASAKADVVVRGRTVSHMNVAEDGAIWKMAVSVEHVFKGETPPILELRLRYDGCIRRPPNDEPVYLFLSAGDYGFTQMNYVIASRAPANFESHLGVARSSPGSKSPTVLTHPIPRLAPEGMSAESVTRTDGEIVTESWTMPVAPVRHWAIPRFYIRYPDAFVLFEAEDVQTAAARWGDADLVRGVLGALPLKVPTDLYQFTLMGRVPRASSPQLEQLAADMLLSGKAIVFSSRGYLSAIRVTRTSLGEQRFSCGDPERVLLTTRFALPDPSKATIQP